MVRNRGKPRPLNGRSPLTVVVAASLLAGTIGSYSLIAPGGLNLLNAQGGRPGVVTASTPGQVAALMAYQRPVQGNAALFAGGNRPSVNRVVPLQVLPADSNGKKPVTFSLFAGWGGAITWDPSTGEVTVAVGVGRQFSLSLNDLPSSGTGKDDGSFFKGAGIQGEFGGKIPQAWASKVPGMQWAAGATITGKLNGKWSTDGSLTFRAIGQLKLPPALVSQLPAEVQPLFKNGSLSYGYQWKVDTHGSADARNWTIVSAETGTLDGQSYSFGSPAKSATDATAGTLSALGSSVFDLFKGGDFGGHVAGNVTVALGPRLRDAINSYMELAFGDYSKQLNQDTKKLQDSNGQLQKDLNKDQGSQNQPQIKDLGNQIGAESGKLQKDISQYQKGTAQGIQDILNNYNKQQQQPQKKSQQAPGLPPGRQNDAASGTRPPFIPPAGQSTTGAPPNPGGDARSAANQGGQQGGPVQGLPGTQSGPAVTPPQRGTQSPTSTQPQRGQGASPGTGQPPGSGTPARSSGQQSSARGLSGAVGGPGGQVPPLLTPPPSVTSALSGGVTLAPPSAQLPQPPTNQSSVQQPVAGGGSRPPGNPPAGGQTQPTGTQPPQTDTQPPSAATPPSQQPPAPASGGNPDVNPDGTINTPPLDRTEPDGTPFQNVPTQPATPGQDPTKPPVIVPPPVADNGGGTQVAGQTPDGTPVITASATATAPVDIAPVDTAPAIAPPVIAPPPPPIEPIPIPVADAPNPVVDSPATVDTADTSLGDTADPSLGDIGTPAGLGGDVGSGGTVVADLGGGIDSGDGGGDG